MERKYSKEKKIQYKIWKENTVQNLVQEQIRKLKQQISNYHYLYCRKKMILFNLDTLSGMASSLPFSKVVFLCVFPKHYKFLDTC